MASQSLPRWTHTHCTQPGKQPPLKYEARVHHWTKSTCTCSNLTIQHNIHVHTSVFGNLPCNRINSNNAEMNNHSDRGSSCMGKKNTPNAQQRDARVTRMGLNVTPALSRYLLPCKPVHANNSTNNHIAHNFFQGQQLYFQSP